MPIELLLPSGILIGIILGLEFVMIGWGIRDGAKRRKKDRKAEREREVREAIAKAREEWLNDFR